MKIINKYKNKPKPSSTKDKPNRHDDDFGLDFIQFQENRREEKQSDKQKNKKD